MATRASLSLASTSLLRSLSYLAGPRRDLSVPKALIVLDTGAPDQDEIRENPATSDPHREDLERKTGTAKSDSNSHTNSRALTRVDSELVRTLMSSM